MLQIQDFTRKNKDIEHFKDLKVLTDVELDNLKQQILEIYNDVVGVCKKYNLSVMLGGGSALGAVRHKGFIPWDDDMDLLMPRKDVEIFIDIFHKELSEKYFLLAPQKKADYSKIFTCIVKKNTKLLHLIDFSTIYPSGVCLDIFTLDNVPNSHINRWLKGMMSILLFFMASSAGLFESRNNTVKRFFSATFSARLYYFVRIHILGRICSAFRYSKIVALHDKISQYKGISNLMGIPTGRKHYFGEIFLSDVFEPTVKGMFEGIEVDIPGKYDAYLKNLYGKNYMELPPEEKRETHPVLEFAI